MSKKLSMAEGLARFGRAALLWGSQNCGDAKDTDWDLAFPRWGLAALARAKSASYESYRGLGLELPQDEMVLCDPMTGDDVLRLCCLPSGEVVFCQFDSGSTCWIEVREDLSLPEWVGDWA